MSADFGSLVAGMFGGMFGDLLPGMGSYPEPPDIVPLRILGLAERPASHDAVRSAFRARLPLVHPDVCAYSAVPWLQDAADALATARPEVAELVWARDVLLRKIPPPVTAANKPGGDLASRNARALSVCVCCDREITGLFGKPPVPAAREHRWRGYCQRCAGREENARRRAENGRQRDLRRQRRADRMCGACGATFTPKRSDGRYCSSACRQKAYREREQRSAA